ncbi:terpene synthase family protein [Streptomyces xanthochromogenes]
MEPTHTPMIHLPFTARQHHQAEAIEKHTRDWILRFRLTTNAGAQALAREQFGTLAALTYPDGTLDGVNFAACWFAWLFIADDQYEEGAYGSRQKWTAVIEAVRAVLRSPRDIERTTKAPLLLALADLTMRLELMASSTWKERFDANSLDTMTAALQELEFRKTQTVPPLAEYIPMRRHASSVINCFDLVELCAQVELPAVIYHSNAWQEIILAATDIVSWTNDLYSLDKEIACGITSNIVLVLREEQRLDQAHAYAQARSVIHDRVQDLLTSEQRLPALLEGMELTPADHDTVHRCVEGIHDWVAGSNQWHDNSTSRYQTLSRTAPEPEGLFGPAHTA